jgi:DNA-binding transcriptional LysR family regulator
MPWDDRVKRRLKLRDLDILIAVVQAKGMSKAARRLNMSQPAVSKAIADLEHALGVRLLDRSHQGIEPTSFGIAIIKRGVVLFNELRQGVQDIDFLADPTAGELRIGATEAIAGAIVAPVIERLTHEYPRMAFHIVTGDQMGTLYRNVAERNAELAITRIAGSMPKEFSTETLFHDPMVVIAGTSNPLTRRRKIALADLVDEFWIQQPPENSFGSLVANAFRASGLPPPRLTASSNSSMLRSELLATGRFLTVVAGFSLRLPRRHPFLRPLPVELPNSRHPVAIITLKDRELSPLAQLFIERVRALTKPLAKSC